jgi:hypothetical protein
MAVSTLNYRTHPRFRSIRNQKGDSFTRRWMRKSPSLRTEPVARLASYFGMMVATCLRNASINSGGRRSDPDLQLGVHKFPFRERSLLDLSVLSNYVGRCSRYGGGCCGDEIRNSSRSDPIFGAFDNDTQQSESLVLWAIRVVGTLLDAP